MSGFVITGGNANGADLESRRGGGIYHSGRTLAVLNCWRDHHPFLLCCHVQMLGAWGPC